ncbi:platelet-derived growth factor C isoform X4 [Dipodomys merriami]
MVLVWRLVTAENMWIQLTFDERFGLEDPEDDICKYDFVEVEEPSDGTVLGRWCGSGAVPGKQISKGNQIRIRFVSDEYFPSEPGFCIHYNIVAPQVTEAVSPTVLPPSALPLDLLNNAVTAFSTLEDLIRYLEPDRWQLDLEDLYRPTWQLLGKAFVFGRKSRVVDLNLLKEEVRLYSCTPRNFSVSIREELKRTDTIFWPGCLLVKRCGGNCACCLHNCNECQCVPSKVTKKYHEMIQSTMLKSEWQSRVVHIMAPRKRETETERERGSKKTRDQQGLKDLCCLPGMVLKGFQHHPKKKHTIWGPYS